MSSPVEARTRAEERRTCRAPGPQPGVPLDEWWSRLRTAPVGLSERAAYERLMRYGLNRIEERRRNPVLKFLSLFRSPIAWIIEIAGILSVLAHQTAGVIIVVALLVSNAFVGFWQDYQAASAGKALRKRLAVKARVKREGRWREIDAAHLVPGDVVRLEPGDIIPADVVLVHGDCLSVDQSTLTGESLPADKRLQDIGYSGSVVKRGKMEGIVTHTGSHTCLGKAAKLVSSDRVVPRFRNAVLTAGNYVIYLSAGLAALVFLVMLFRGSSVPALLEFALILLVAAIPVAIPVVLSGAMAFRRGHSRKRP